MTAPPHPGLALRECVLPGLGPSVSRAAREIRSARLSGTSPRFWLDLQQRHDIWHAERALAAVLALIPARTLPAAVRARIGPAHDD